MNVLITGGCGFLGSNIARDILDKKSSNLFILDNLYREGSKENLKWLRGSGKFTFLNSDIRDRKKVERAIKKIKPEVIFHLAGQVAMTTSIEKPRFDFDVNTLGTLNILEAIKNFSKDSALIYSSTNKVYGDLEWVEYEEKEKRYVAKDFPNGFSESIPLDFHSPYGCSKGSADQYVLDFSRLYGLKTAVFRHSSMFGVRQFSTFDQGWLGWFCKKAIETKNKKLKEPFTISGNGKQVRDVLYSSDMISLYLQSAENIDKINGNAFNIGGGMGNSLSLLELFGILEDELGVELGYSKLPWRFSDQKVFVADISKIKKMLGWRPKTDKFTGIKELLKWVLDYGQK